MSQFTRSVPFETEFDGDHITMTLRPLNRKEVIVIQGMGGKEDKAAVPDALRKVLNDVVNDFSGLTVDGEQLPLVGVYEEVYFDNLLKIIVDKLFDISTPDEVQEKNSAGPSASSPSSDDATPEK